MSGNLSVSIAVWKGDPLDYQKYRHTGVFIEFDDEDADDLFVHVIGTTGLYDFQARRQYDPEKSVSLAAMIPVGRSQKNVTPAQVMLEAQLVAVNNLDKEWNCQNWVHEFLKRLSGRGIITSNQCLEGFDAMVTEIMEAEHEPR